MAAYNRNFLGVWIPKEIWLSDKLSLMEKVLFAEIESLDNEKGCWASNRYFAEFFGVSDRQIRTHITSLKNKGFVTVRIANRNQRTIRCTGKWKKMTEAQRREMEAKRADLAKKFGTA